MQRKTAPSKVDRSHKFRYAIKPLKHYTTARMNNQSWEARFARFMLDATFTGERLGRGAYGIVEKVTAITIKLVILCPLIHVG